MNVDIYFLEFEGAVDEKDGYTKSTRRTAMKEDTRAML